MLPVDQERWEQRGHPHRQFWQNLRLALWRCMVKNDLKIGQVSPTLQAFPNPCMLQNRYSSGRQAGLCPPPVMIGHELVTDWSVSTPSANQTRPPAVMPSDGLARAGTPGASSFRHPCKLQTLTKFSGAKFISDKAVSPRQSCLRVVVCAAPTL